MQNYSIINMPSFQNAVTYTQIDRQDVNEPILAYTTKTTFQKILRKMAKYLRIAAKFLLAGVFAVYFLVVNRNSVFIDKRIAFVTIGFLAIFWLVVLVLAIAKQSPSYFCLYLALSLLIMLSIAMAKGDIKYMQLI